MGFPRRGRAVGDADGVAGAGCGGGAGSGGRGSADAADTLFDLASLTKIIAVWAGLGMLWENAQIDLDDPLAKHLPDAAGFPLGAVTIRQFLTHTSGVPLRANSAGVIWDRSRKRCGSGCCGRRCVGRPVRLSSTPTGQR